MVNGLLMSSSIGGLLVIVAEALRIKKVLRNETSRKLIHIAHGLVVASWPFFTNYSFIITAEILFFVVVLLARTFRIMQPLRSVNRRSWGELFFPLGVIALALQRPSPGIFLVAMLHLALADAVATLVGQRAQKGRYYILGYQKSIAGSVAFYVASLGIMIGAITHLAVYPTRSMLFAVAVIPLAAMLTENFSPYGSDNFSVPLVVIWLLQLV